MSLEGTVTAGYNLSENEEFQYHLTLTEATSQQFIAGVLEKQRTELTVLAKRKRMFELGTSKMQPHPVIAQPP